METALKRGWKIAAGIAAAAALMLALGGCAANVDQPTSAETSDANRNYMAQVNQIVDELGVKLTAFDDAVSRDDVVSMRTQADGAFAVLDKLDKLETPDDLKEVQEFYSDGCSNLKDALSAYVDLYTEISSATDDQPFDYSTYDERLKSIQDTYNQGIEALKAGDQKASEL
ncbi:MAG: hypothetical protein HFJ66_02245 [Eggerthellaceae bacterium]|nr:hypothetical protein [Eggerthellaceae bacterium]